jgi:hypothetical protein
MPPRRRAKVLEFYGLLGDDARELFGALGEESREDLARDAWNHNPRRACDRLMYLTPDPRKRTTCKLEGKTLAESVEVLAEPGPEAMAYIPKVADRMLVALGGERKYWNFYHALCRDVALRVLPVEGVVRALGNAMGPQSREPARVLGREIGRLRGELRRSA